MRGVRVEKLRMWNGKIPLPCWPIPATILLVLIADLKYPFWGKPCRLLENTLRYTWLQLGGFHMPIRLNGSTYYTTAEACRMAGISKNTFLRWVKEKSFVDVAQRDRHGWRLFSQEDLGRLEAAVNKVIKVKQ